MNVAKVWIGKRINMTVSHKVLERRYKELQLKNIELINKIKRKDREIRKHVANIMYLRDVGKEVNRSSLTNYTTIK